MGFDLEYLCEEEIYMEEGTVIYMYIYTHTHHLAREIRFFA